jgi:hypothetical protein
MLRKVKLNLDFDHFTKCDYPDFSSCTKHQVHELKDIHQEFGGFPQSYVFENTRIKQRWWDQTEIDFAELGSQLSMEVVTVSTIKQYPGNTIPWHRDTFYQIKKRFPERKDEPVRANINLEDWKLGHFIQYNDTVYTHWQAGEGYMWDSTILHLGANAGMEPKFTIQVSGYLN